MHHSSPPPTHRRRSQSRHYQPRTTTPLPSALLDHSTTDLEEGLYTQAFTLLTSALTSGTSNSNPSKAAQIPPPSHLALAATLAVHPNFTTRTTSPEKHAAADDALRYLRLVNALVVPREAGLDKAFRFSDATVSSRNKRAKLRVAEDVNGVDDSSDAGRIRSSYADEASLWSNAEDFWSLVGWALNCSVLYPARWERWRAFLELLLDVVEDDLEERLPAAREAYQTGGVVAVQEALRDSMLTQYLLPVGEGRNNRRRVMRAIVADGSRASLAEFGEIWRRETKLPKQQNQIEQAEERNSKRRKLDLENGDFGDYFDDSEQEDSPPKTGDALPRSRSTTSLRRSNNNGTTASNDNTDSDTNIPSGTNTPNGTNISPPTISSYGGIPSIALRQRLLALLLHFSTMNPTQFLTKEDLLDLYTEFLRPLPLPVFQQFILPLKPYLQPGDQAALCQMLLRPLLAGAGPVYREPDSSGSGVLPLTQKDFERYYAPFAANKGEAGENAKVALLVECLLRLLWAAPGGLTATEGLKQVVERGITGRREKVAWDGRRKTGVKARSEEEAVRVLEASGERLRMVLEMCSSA